MYKTILKISLVLYDYAGSSYAEFKFSAACNGYVWSMFLYFENELLTVEERVK